MAESIARVFLENLEDTAVLQDELPALPKEVLVALCKHCMPELERIIEAYDEEMSGGLAFTYCDTAADFLEVLWNVCDSEKIRGIIIARLVHMGTDNNRWHVGEVLGRIAAQLEGTDPAVMVLRDELAENSRARDFNRSYLARAGLPRVVRDVLRQTEPD